MSTDFDFGTIGFDNLISGLRMAIMTRVGSIILTVIIGAIAISWLCGIFERMLKKRKIDEALHKFVLSAIKIGMIILLIIIIMAELGIPTAPVITVLGASGAAIALALRDSLANVAGGIIIIMTKPILKGEVIEVEGSIGTVDSVDLLVTHIHTVDNKRVNIPNGKITNSIVTNYSREDIRRVDCQFTISYASDFRKAKELLEAVATSCPLVLDKPDFVIGVDRYSEDGIVLDLKTWTKTESFFDVKYFLEENVKLAFDEADVSLAGRQIDVKMNNK